MCSVWILLNFRSFSCCFFDLKRLNARKKDNPWRTSDTVVWLTTGWKMKFEICFKSNNIPYNPKTEYEKNFAARIKILGIGFME